MKEKKSSENLRCNANDIVLDKKMNLNEGFDVKKRMQQRSIPDLFKKMKTNEPSTSNSGCITVEFDDDVSERRELLAAAAELRMKSEASSSENSSHEIASQESCSTLSSPKSPEENVSLGKSLNLLNRLSNCTNNLSALDLNHIFLVDYKALYSTSLFIQPYPATYTDKWDSDHVRMPCSPDNLYPVTDEMGSKSVESRWDLIQKMLKKPILSCADLERTIMAYNTRYIDKWNFRGLHYFFQNILDADESKLVFDEILPTIVKLVLETPVICTQAPPLLKQGRNCSFTLSQKQIACLLANAFFCTFPRRNNQRKQTEYYNYPDINFIHLFTSAKPSIPVRQAEKYKCIFHYFLRFTKKEPVGCVTYHRQCIKDFPNWESSTKKLRGLHVTSQGTIEDEGTGMLQVDFANRFIGGGVLGRGCVQEEIRFVICPELIAARLFTESFLANECLIITGCERFSKYEGYSDEFVWNGDFIDKTPRDSLCRRMTQVVAIDATNFRLIKANQFEEKWLRRELNKAFCGFYVPNATNGALPAVASGNWGCGAYRGDPHLKFLLQLIAAAQSNRDLMYFTFRNTKLCSEIYSIYEFLISKDLSVGDLWKILLLYQEVLKCSTSNKTLYDFIREALEPPFLEYDEDTE